MVVVAVIELVPMAVVVLEVMPMVMAVVEVVPMVAVVIEVVPPTVVVVSAGASNTVCVPVRVAVLRTHAASLKHTQDARDADAKDQFTQQISLRKNISLVWTCISLCLVLISSVRHYKPRPTAQKSELANMK